MTRATTQRQRLADVLQSYPIVRAYELRSAGIAAPTISRAMQSGELVRICRGLYQSADGDIDAEQTLAEAIKMVPRGVIAMTSALEFHELTDQMPRRVWVAISNRDWAPTLSWPPVRIIEFNDKYMSQGIEHYVISGVTVPIFSVPKTLADVFRHKHFLRSVAIEALRAALEQRKATPAAIAKAAMEGGAWKKMRPYLEALTSNY